MSSKGKLFIMNTTISLVFDLDGVLLDSETDISWLTRAAERTLEHFGIQNNLHHVEALYSKNVKRFKEISDQIGIEPKKLWPIRNQYYTEEKLNAMKKMIIKPFPDVSTLYRLNDDYELSIISNSPQSVVDYFIYSFNYSDLFTFGIGRGDGIKDIKLMKPHPHLYTKFLEKTKAKMYLYIGDRESDRIFAEKTGMRFFLIDRTGTQDDGFFSLLDFVEHIVSIKNKEQ